MSVLMEGRQIPLSQHQRSYLDLAVGRSVVFFICANRISHLCQSYFQRERRWRCLAWQPSMSCSSVGLKHPPPSIIMYWLPLPSIQCTIGFSMMTHHHSDFCLKDKTSDSFLYLVTAGNVWSNRLISIFSSDRGRKRIKSYIWSDFYGIFWDRSHQQDTALTSYKIVRYPTLWFIGNCRSSHLNRS